MTLSRGVAAWTRRGAVTLLLGSMLTGCQALQEVLPTKPTDPRPTPSQSPVAIPVVLGAPAPAPTPTPTSSPNPSPSPTPFPPVGGSCSLPPSNTPNADCAAVGPQFLASVDKAITQLTQQQPSLFGPTTSVCENCYYVRDASAYATGVIKNLNAAGFCAYYDGEELAVKNSNSFNEQYDILLASGHIRRGSGSYRVTCTPSWF